MALATTQTLSGDSPTDVDTSTTVFVQRFSDEAKAVFSVSGLTAPAEVKLTVSHELGKAGEKRHLIRLDNTASDAFGVPATASWYVVGVIPPSSAFTATALRNQLFQLIDFLIEGGAGANIISILNNET